VTTFLVHLRDGSEWVIDAGSGTEDGGTLRFDRDGQPPLIIGVGAWRSWGHAPAAPTLAGKLSPRRPPGVWGIPGMARNRGRYGCAGMVAGMLNNGGVRPAGDRDGQHRNTGRGGSGGR
jgi:hypothetical protein